MIAQIFIASVVISLTILVETLFFLGARIVLRRFGTWLMRPPYAVKIFVSLNAVTLWFLLAFSICCWVWAATFVWLGLFEGLEPALYFTIVVITTLGFGDVILPVPWRLLSGICAANGLLLIGLTTAFLVEFLRKLIEAQEQEQASREVSPF